MASQQEILKYFAQVIYQNLGIVYSETNYFQLEHRLRDIYKQLNLTSIEELYLKAQGGLDPRFRTLLLDQATNNETSFFRDSHIFKTLVGKVLPEWVQKHGGKSHIKIWSAASSSGQEVYSLIMELEEAKKQGVNIPSYSILATDISEAILTRAREGKYSQLEVQRGLPARLLVQYFQKAGDNIWEFKPEYKRAVTFQKLNLLEIPEYLGPFDVVLVRNVLIYQDIENKKLIIEKIRKNMNTGGIFLLGAAETLFGLTEKFTQQLMNDCIFYYSQ